MTSTSLSADARRRFRRSSSAATSSGGLMTTRLLKTTVDSRLGQKLSRRDTLIGSSPRALKRAGVEIKPRVTGRFGTDGQLRGWERPLG